MKLTALKNMDDAQLMKLSGAFSRIHAAAKKLCTPSVFFGTLAAVTAAQFFLAAPALIGLTMAGLFGAVVGGAGIGATGEDYIENIRKARHSASLSAAQSAVSQLPDLSDAFSKGTEKAVTVRTLRYKNTKSAFLSS